MPRECPNISVGCIYHHDQSAESHRNMGDHIIKATDHIQQRHPYTGILVIGDFNQFPDYKVKKYCRLKQIVNIPTRGEVTLDKIFTNMSNMYDQPITLPPLGSSDHNIVLVKPGSYSKAGTNSSYKSRVVGRNEKAFFVNDLLKVPWERMFHLDSCQEKYDFFASTIQSLVNTHFPVKTINKNSTDKPWITERFKVLVKQRQHAWKSGNILKYKYLRNKVNRENATLRERFFKNKVSHLKATNPKNWYRDMMCLMGNGKSKSTAQMDHLANVVCDDGDLSVLCNKINLFFQSLCEHLPPLDHSHRDSGGFLDVTNYIIEVEQAEKCLSGLNRSKATGPDDIPTWVLKEFASFWLNLYITCSMCQCKMDLYQQFGNQRTFHLCPRHAQQQK